MWCALLLTIVIGGGCIYPYSINRHRTFFCTFAAKEISVLMEISSLYSIFLHHPVITTDSRHCVPDSIFFALKGASFDGNAFAASALQQGCAYAVVDEAEYATPDDKRIIVVDNVLKTLQRLANYHRRRLGTKIIGITGTNGKTTTKELIAHVLMEKYKVLYTQGNLNNSIGVPLTLLRLTEKDEVAVIEMGASHPGDIKELVEIVEPDFGIITNVGKAHLQGFGSFEGVIRTKGELYDYLRTKPQSVIFLHNDNPYLNRIAEGLSAIRYGKPGADGIPNTCGEVVECAPFLHFHWRQGRSAWHEVQTHLIGSYNIDNMLAAVAVGLYFGLTPAQIDDALSRYVPTNNRSQLEETAHNHLIIDAYNANPTSMAAALDNFHHMKVSPKMAILGAMKELGEHSAEEHQKVVDLLQEYQFDKVWLVGEEFAQTRHTERTFLNADEVIEALKEEQPQHYYILIKGSNSMKLSRLAEYL